MFALLADGAAFLIASTLAWVWVRPDISPTAYSLVAVGGMMLLLVALAYCEAYTTDALMSLRPAVYSLTLAMGLGSLAALGVYFLVQTPPGSVRCAAHVAVLFLPLLLAERVLLQRLGLHPAFHDRTLIVGASELGAAITRLILERGRLKIVGFLSDRETHIGGAIEGFPVLGKTHEIGKVVDKMRVDRVIVASRDRDEHFPAEDLFLLKARGIRIDSGLDFYEQTSGRIYLEGLRPSYLIFSQGFNLGFVGEMVKRACDIGVAAIGLSLAAPLLAILAVAIKRDSPGPVFYGQERAGCGGRVFRILKLRTMYQDAEKETGPVFTARADTRITKIGRLLRASRLDEIPQFWNVLVGEMSLVGPRPERPEFVEDLCQVHPYFSWRSCVKPGITGWAQIRFGYVNDVEAFGQKLSLDLFYLKHRTLAFDLFILWETVKTAVLLRGL